LAPRSSPPCSSPWGLLHEFLADLGSHLFTPARTVERFADCWTGRMAAPDHVLYDDATGQESVYRQPKNAVEVDRLLFAAWNDPCRGYGWDGDQHWTADSVRTW
jgi:hypothetical protein